MARPKDPIYVLPHGIEVIGEYPPSETNPYWRVRIRPHRFFPDAYVRCGGMDIHRSRAFLAAKLGRPLRRSDHVHHGDDGKTVDELRNLTLLTAAEHNRRHKNGSRHSDEAKARISAGLKRALAEGRWAPPPPPNWIGRKHSEESKRRMSEAHLRGIAEGRIKKQRPPDTTGRQDTARTRAKKSAFAKQRPRLNGRFI